MGLLSFNKKKKQQQQQQQKTNNNNNRNGTTTATTPFVGTATTHASAQLATVPSMESTAEKKASSKKWTPIRRKVTTPATTASATGPQQQQQRTQQQQQQQQLAPSSNVLGSLSVMALDDVEVMTLESQRAMMDQREAIRRKLFENSILEGNRAMTPTSTTSSTPAHVSESSHEILPNGDIRTSSALTRATTPMSPSDRFSLPIEAVVSRSWSLGSLQKISEEPVEYGTPSRRVYSAGPVSVDISYTESELESVRTKESSLVSTKNKPSPISSYPDSLLNPITPAAGAATAETTSTSGLVPRRVVSQDDEDDDEYDDDNDYDHENNNNNNEVYNDIAGGAEPPEEAIEASFTTTAASPSSSDRGFVRSQYDKFLAAVVSPVLGVGGSSSLAPSIVVASSLSSPANNNNISSQSAEPIDERLIDQEFQDALNRGKSPLKGMPDDERLEYQKDEMKTILVPLSPEKSSESIQQHRVLDDTSSEHQPLNDTTVQQQQQQKDDGQHSETTPPTSVEQNSYSATSTSYTTSYGDTTTRASSSAAAAAMVPELARSIMMAAMQCGTGAVSHATKTVDGACGGVNSSLLWKGTTTGSTSEHHRNRGGDIPSESGESTSLGTTTTTTAVPHHPILKRRVYLDEASTVRFLRRIVNNGFVLLYLQPSDDDDDDDITGNVVPTDDWKGRTVTMTITKGCFFPTRTSNSGPNGINNINNNSDVDSTRQQPPRLEWITVTGGLSTDAQVTSVDLLDIQSILTNDEDKEEDENMCFFTITDGNGDVHIFEAATLEERNRIVHGLKTILARWSFHLIAGDITATTELYSNHAHSKNLDEDMPSLPNPSQTMHQVSHMLLDSSC